MTTQVGILLCTNQPDLSAVHNSQSTALIIDGSFGVKSKVGWLRMMRGRWGAMCGTRGLQGVINKNTQPESNEPVDNQQIGVLIANSIFSRNLQGVISEEHAAVPDFNNDNEAGASEGEQQQAEGKDSSKQQQAEGSKPRHRRSKTFGSIDMDGLDVSGAGV